MLYGDKVRLRALEDADVEVMQRWVNELEGLATTRDVPHLRSKKELDQGLKERSNDAQQMVVETMDGRPIGLVQLKDVDWVHRHAELNLLIGESDHRGRGFEEDSIRTMAAYAFRVLNMHRVGVSLVGESERVRRYYEACGFKFEGRREDFYWAGDRYLDAVQLRLLAHEFHKPQGPQGEGA